MALFADDARRILQNLPVRIPKPVFNLLTRDTKRWKTMREETVIWLQAVHGDPIRGRTLSDVNAELWKDEDEGEIDQDFEPGQASQIGPVARIPKPDVTIDDPASLWMPRAYLDGLSDIEFALTSVEARHCLVATRWEVRGKHT